MFTREPFPGSTETSIDFIEDKHYVLLITQSAQERQKPWRWNIKYRPALEPVQPGCPNASAIQNASQARLDAFEGICFRSRRQQCGERNEASEWSQLSEKT
jgi:hypothetical protein